VVGPDLAITKTPDRTVADAGDIVTYTVVATAHDFGFTGPAFDVLLRDALPSGLVLVADSARLLSAPAGTPPITEDGNEVRLSIPELKPGETIRFSYQARLADTVGAGTVLTNTVALKADSFPGTPPPCPAEFQDPSAHSTSMQRPKCGWPRWASRRRLPRQIPASPRPRAPASIRPSSTSPSARS
jgi:uncharacterized repeat protein (TIGR01451 family)